MYTPTAFAARALSLVGLPYHLGAEWAPSTVAPAKPKALDCSELVEGLFRENGTSIGDLAASQYGKTVKASGSVRVGDLVFLRNNPARWNGIGHVAVVVGGAGGVKPDGAGQYAVVGEPIIVEARGRASGVVRTTLTYWKGRAHYTGLRRFPGFKLAAEPTSGDVVFRSGQLNLELWGGNQSPASFAARGAYLHDKMRCSLYLLQETSPALPAYPGDMRAALRAELGPQWQFSALSEVAIFWDGDKFDRAGADRAASFGVYQGALCTPLRHQSGFRFDAISTHVRPGKVASPADKRADIRRAFGLAKSWAAIEGGDHNTREWRDLLPTGWTAATPDVDTQAAGALDHIGIRSGTSGTLAVRNVAQLDPGPVSDHTAWVVTLAATIK